MVAVLPGVDARGARPARHPGPARARRAVWTDTVAGALTARLAPEPDTDLVRAVNAALVLLADHELATSTVAVRVAASTRADLYDAVLAGLGVLAGPLHGGASQLAYGLVRDAEQLGPERALDETLRWQHRLPGFGHPVYRGDDPRFTVLKGLVDELWPPDRRRLVLDALLALAAAARHPRAQRRPGARRAHCGRRHGRGRRPHHLHHRPGGGMDGALPRGARGAAHPLPGPGRLRQPSLTPKTAAAASTTRRKVGRGATIRRNRLTAPTSTTGTGTGTGAGGQFAGSSGICQLGFVRSGRGPTTPKIPAPRKKFTFPAPRGRPPRCILFRGDGPLNEESSSSALARPHHFRFWRWLAFDPPMRDPGSRGLSEAGRDLSGVQLGSGHRQRSRRRVLHGVAPPQDHPSGSDLASEPPHACLDRAAWLRSRPSLP